LTILVCPLSRVAEVVALRSPERIVSLLDPEFQTPDVGPNYVGRHLRLSFHDIHQPSAGVVPPSSEHVDELLAFIRGWNRAAPLLIHCRAGIGRSTATAFIAACLHWPEMDEREIAAELRRVAPSSRPNEVLVRLADRAMQRQGRMSRAITEIGRGLPDLTVSEGTPFELLPSDDRLPQVIL